MTFGPRPRFAWQLRSRTLPLGERTLLMAIINLTPDSFSGDGLADAPFARAVQASLAALDGGAGILDLGAESTRPNARPLSSAHEQERLLPILEAILHERPSAVISVDTYHAATARAALAAGAEIVNDVSGLLWDEAMAGLIAETACGLVLMHTRGRPQHWSAQPPIPAEEVVPLVLDSLRDRLDEAQTAGIAAGSIVVDPGFGFGKLGAENFALLAGLDQLATLGHPVLAGVSRKKFLAEAVAPVQPAGLAPAKARLNATTAANVAAILAGAHILRVHDLQPAREAAAVADQLRGG